MRKKALLSMALLTAAAVGSTPVTSYAACTMPAGVPAGGNCKIYSGQDLESLQKTLKELGITIGGSNCPNVNIPGIQFPGNFQPPVSGSPDTPDMELPDVQEPETPPQVQKPETGTPDSSAASYAEQVVSLVNEERAKAGLSPLTVQTDITAAANVRAKEIKQQFSHTRPDGSSFSSALKQQGVSFSGSGENIAYGQRTPQQVMEGWMNSSGHRANILNGNYKNIGIGYYQDEQGVNYWVQLFTY